MIIINIVDSAFVVLHDVILRVYLDYILFGKFCVREEVGLKLKIDELSSEVCDDISFEQQNQAYLIREEEKKKQ